MHETILLPSRSNLRPRHRRILFFFFFLVVVLLFSSRTAVSYYVETLWFESLGYGGVFWKTITLGWAVFGLFAAGTFLVLYGWFRLLLRVAAPDLRSAGTMHIGNRVINLPVEGALRIGGLAIAVLVALGAGAAMKAEWPRFALYWFQPQVANGPADPIFGRPLSFYLFTLPVWQNLSGWLLMLAILMCASGVFLVLISTGSRLSTSGFDRSIPLPWRTFSIAVAFLLLVIAMRVYLGRLELLLEDHTVFGGITYTDAHVILVGMLVVCCALILGAAISALNWVTRPRLSWLVIAPIPAVICYVIVQIAAWYVSSFIVKPNQLVREQPYIAHNIDFTRQAYGLDRIAQHEFPADISVEAADAANNQTTLQNIRLWDWQALRDTLRQIQEIRTYYDFPDVDIDRYSIDGQMRQVMLATRELSVEKLPESSRNWINEKLIYTHGYGITMNPVNGFTPEGLPNLILANMPIQSTVKSISVTRPEVYFGQLSDTDVYVKTQQKEFNYPQGETNSVTSYEGAGGIVMGGLVRRILIAFDRGDLSKVPFSDDIGTESRLLMRRSLQDRVNALAPFLTFDTDPYMVVGDDGKLSWMLDAFTTTDTFPYATHYTLRDRPINYLRNSVKVVVDAYTGATTFYVFDSQDPDHRRVSWHLPVALQGCIRHAARSSPPRALPRAAAQVAGAGVRAVSHDESDRLLQPRRSMDDRLGSGPGPEWRASRAVHGAELRPHEAA